MIENRRTALCSAFAMAALLASCRTDSGARIEQNKHPDPVREEQGDREMEAATRRAQETLPEFVKALGDTPSSAKGFAIKKEYTDGRKHESIWLSDVKLAGNDFHAKVSNVPILVKQIKAGDDAFVKREEVVDWMFIDNDTLSGGYTIRVLVHRATPERKRELERSLGFKVPPL